MDAALNMCKELYQVGELAENLTVMTREQWIRPHCNLNDNVQMPAKNKNAYKATVYFYQFLFHSPHIYFNTFLFK